jgi:hypothetical protein
MRCAECHCVDEHAGGWVAFLGRDPDDDGAAEEVVAFCPACAAAEFRLAVKTAETYL